jgi:radical SAM superfamily enzyme YgiQ (UPF0313 family)
MDQDIQIRDVASGAFWLVLSHTGLQVAGTADLQGEFVLTDQLPLLRQLSRGVDDAPEGLDPAVLRVARLTRSPAMRVDDVQAATSQGATRPEGDATLGAPLLFRVVNGQILAWSHTSHRLVALSDRHVELLTQIAASDPAFSTDDLDGPDTAALVDVVAHSWLRPPVVPAAPSVPVAIRTTSAPPVEREEPPATAPPVEAASDASGIHPAHELDQAQEVDQTHGADQARTTNRTDGNGPDDQEPATRRRGVVGRVLQRVRLSSGRPTAAPVPVWPVTCAVTYTDTEMGNALGLGMLIAAATAHDGGRLCDHYDFRPIRISADEALVDIAAADRPGVLLLSSYIWSIDGNLELAARVKERSPRTIVVTGGPSAPKYEQDAKDFLTRHPQIDVIVRGEGEVTVSELLSALDGDLGHLAALAEVDGLTVRLGDRIVRTPDRERLADLNSVPSPYLTGLFDHLPAHKGIWAVETNRGCPYGCTFCDWGSATKSRIRKFDMDRVTAEFDWLSRHGVQAIFLADANFGIFERDLDITRHVADLHARWGAPTSFIASFAKNTTKYTVPIIRTLIDAGLSGDVAIAFQTTDDDTLDNISRSNIKVETYDQLARDVRADGLPILADIMIGLPGATIETLKKDLQHCVDSDVTARVFGTIVLPNSPMNDPEYRELHQIRTDSLDQVVATASFDPEDREEMVRFRDVFRWADHFGVLRHVMRWEAHRSGRRELDVLWQIAQVAPARAETYPLLAFMVRSGRRYMVEPMSWHAFYAEVGRFLVDELGAADDAEVRTVLTVQEALMPAAGRTFPDVVHLEHDYVAFYREVLRPRDGRSADRRLGDYPPGQLTVEDPDGISPGCLREMFLIEHSPEGARNLSHEGEFWDAFNWELSSPLQRALRPKYYAPSTGWRSRDSARSLPVLLEDEASLTGTTVGDPATASAEA